MGAELCLAHDMGGGGGGIWGPLSVDMQPYGCFIRKKFSQEIPSKYITIQNIGYSIKTEKSFHLLHCMCGIKK